MKPLTIITSWLITKSKGIFALKEKRRYPIFTNVSNANFNNLLSATTEGGKDPSVSHVPKHWYNWWLKRKKNVIIKEFLPDVI